MEELFPHGGVYLPLVTVLNSFEEPKKDAGKLFHTLFKKLFEGVDLMNAVAFGGILAFHLENSFGPKESACLKGKQIIIMV